MRFLYTIAFAALLVSPTSAQQVDLPVVVDVEMMPGLVRILRVEEPVGLVIIGDPAVADTQILGERGISITALGVGRTSVVLLNDNSDVIVTADVNVVPTSRGLGRQGVSVRSFGSGKSEYVTHTYFCGGGEGQAACAFDGSKRNFAPPPVVSTGPILAGETAEASEPTEN